MIITYFRSSSYNAHDMCEMQYFSEYVLGWKGPGGIKADKGTIVHKVLEILAICKKALQDKEGILLPIEDEIVGTIHPDNIDIHDICEKVYQYYVKHKKQDWTDKDFKDCKAWVQKVLDFNNGAFNPLNMHIIAPEQAFDIPIQEPWSTYQYVLDGQKIDGFLSLKGTIDLIVQPSPGILEIVDWKTGRRLNWATGEEKTHEKLSRDPQLMMYFLAAHHLYPDAEQIMVTIYFINDGGPFSICFDKSQIADTYEMLRKKFEYIRDTKVPKCSVSWKCKKFCHQGTHSFDQTTDGIRPIFEFRENQTCALGTKMTICEQLKFELARKAMDRTIKEYKNPNHSIGTYTNPGGI